jgi:hypothetical protein
MSWQRPWPLAKFRKYPDAKAGCKVVPMVGIWGEVGADFVS